MSGKRQKTQYSLALEPRDRGEAPVSGYQGAEPLVAKSAHESPAWTEQLMETVCSRENLETAWKRVRSNKGGPGVDGMTIDDAKGYLREHWPSIRDRLLKGTYQPQPVKRVEIPKPEGGVRKLGVPCIVDRLIQQALLQVLQEQWDPPKITHVSLAAMGERAQPLQGAAPSWRAKAPGRGCCRFTDGILAHVRTPGGPTGPAQPLLRVSRSPSAPCLCPSLIRSNRRGTDPYARWCGRGGAARRPPIPINSEYDGPFLGPSSFPGSSLGRQLPRDHHKDVASAVSTCNARQAFLILLCQHSCDPVVASSDLLP